MSIELIIQASGSLYDSITKEFSDASAKSYKLKENNTTKEVSLKELDDWRWSDLPQTLVNRYEEGEATWITKSELVLLMDWKLAKGKFRPTLPKLIQSNESEIVERVSKSAYEILTEYFNKTSKANFSNKGYVEVVAKSLKIICELRGVGPATGSLILSLLHKLNDLAPPFFSDESFLFFVVDSTRPDTKIKYNAKEYTHELIPVYLGILPVEGKLNNIEKGAWALKSYNIYKNDRLINVKPEFDVPEELLVLFKDQGVKEEDVESPDEEPLRKKRKSKK